MEHPKVLPLFTLIMLCCALSFSVDLLTIITRPSVHLVSVSEGAISYLETASTTNPLQREHPVAMCEITQRLPKKGKSKNDAANNPLAHKMPYAL